MDLTADERAMMSGADGPAAATALADEIAVRARSSRTGIGIDARLTLYGPSSVGRGFDLRARADLSVRLDDGRHLLLVQAVPGFTAAGQGGLHCRPEAWAIQGLLWLPPCKSLLWRDERKQLAGPRHQGCQAQAPTATATEEIENGEAPQSIPVYYVRGKPPIESAP